MRRDLAIPLVIANSLILSACGGVRDPSPLDDNKQSEIGVFLDSAVEGLHYKSESQSGLTNDDGEFTYLNDEQMTFSIGAIELPSVEAKNIITPLDIFETTDLENIGVINLARLLQTLDIDGNAENGIRLAENIHDLAANLSVDFTSHEFDEQVELLISENNSMNSATYTQLISAEMAIEHLESTLDALSCGSDHPAVGSTGEFSTLAHGVSGHAEIIDNCTIQITNFNYDATAPAVYFYGANNNSFSNGFTIGEQLRDNGIDYVNDTITITLPENKTLDDLSHLSVWCVEVSVNFGSFEFSK